MSDKAKDAVLVLAGVVMGFVLASSRCDSGHIQVDNHNVVHLRVRIESPQGSGVPLDSRTPRLGLAAEKLVPCQPRRGL